MHGLPPAPKQRGAMPLPPPPAAPKAKRALPPRPAPGRGVREPARPDLQAGEIRGRNGEILTRSNRSNDVADQFDIPNHFFEKGWDFQWQPLTVHGKEYPQGVHNMMENGWRGVPSERFPGHWHPKGYSGSIVRDGQLLMERPTPMNDQARLDGIRAAKRQRLNQSAAFQGTDKVLDETGGSRAGFAGADETTASRKKDRSFLNRTIEQAPHASYPSRTLAQNDDA